MKISVLDHGYVEFIEAWGHGRENFPEKGEGQHDFERGIIEAARQSTQGSFRGWEGAECDCVPSGVAVEHLPECASKKNPGDKRLLAHLYENDHNTPFEFAGMVIEVQAPIFVFREWQRHRTQSYNEMSARYAPLPNLYYRTNIDHLFGRALKARDEKNKQAGSVVSGPIDRRELQAWLDFDNKLEDLFEDHYQCGLRIGVPKELARKKMPVDHYSRMRAQANLRNWLAFLTLRCDSKVQWETQQFALAVQTLIDQHFPRTWSLWAASL